MDVTSHRDLYFAYSPLMRCWATSLGESTTWLSKQPHRTRNWNSQLIVKQKKSVWTKTSVFRPWTKG